MKLIYILIALFFTTTSYAQVDQKKQRAIDSSHHVAINPKNSIDVRLKAYKYCAWKTIYVDFNQGLKHSIAFLEFAKTSSDYKMTSKAYHYLGHSQMMLGLFDEASKTLQEGLDNAIKNNYHNGIAELNGDLGNLNNSLGNSELALAYHYKSLEHSQTYNLRIEYARAQINIGEIYEAQGKYKLSIETFEEALNYCHINKLVGFKSSIYESLGDINLSIKEYKTAEKNYTTAVDYAKRLNNNNRLIHSLNKLGELHIVLNNLITASAYFKQALHIATTRKAYVSQAKIRANLAHTYLLQNDTRSALEYISLAINQFENLKIKDDLDKAYIIAANIYSKRNQISESHNYYQKAYHLAKESNLLQTLKLASEGLALTHEKRGDLLNSVKYHKEFNTYNNKIRDEEDIKDIIRLDLQDTYKQKSFKDSINKVNEIKQLQFEYNKKEERSKLKNYIAITSILALILIVLCITYYYFENKKTAAVLAAKNKAIKAALKDKEILLKEVHHRVKNNMQVVSSILYLKSKSTEDDVTKEALSDSKKRIDAMQLVHQKMYQKGNYQQIDVLEYFNDIVNLLLKPIQSPEDRFEVHGKVLWLDVEQAQALGFILHELIANSIKHAWGKTDHKQVDIRAAKIGTNTITFNYTDNGKGLPERFNIETTKSFGMKLVYSLSTRQLLGKIKTNNANGFALNITFNAR
ncbi:histidine kinase dimerization/phosphoacceptor domain -containing protein [Winogradskyella sediminis]|uniref:tetratricopeptide repeat-containing sensor histidine kinase n=1 Tax=Winogradskyella sediminis TaxID=1382466 RepID=UPI003AA92445